MEWLGWVLSLALLTLFVASMRLSQTKRTNLRSYIVYLLLEDGVRSAHKQSLINWITAAEVRDAMQLSIRAQGVLESMADSLAREQTSSILAAHAMLWRVKTQSTSLGE
jgi:di/tricarboxylate transporter